VADSPSFNIGKSVVAKNKPELSEFGKDYVYDGYIGGPELDEGLQSKTQRLDATKFKERVYGDKLQSEIAAADKYNKANNIPWRMGNYLSVNPIVSAKPSLSYHMKFNRGADRDSEVNVPVFNENSVKPGGTIADLANRRLGRTSSDVTAGSQLPRSAIDRLGIGGLKPGDKATPEGFTGHELSHAATISPDDEYMNTSISKYLSSNFGHLYGAEKPRWARNNLPRYERNKSTKIPRDASTYIDRVGEEVIPVATALQEHQFKNIGSRITNNRQYDEMLKKYYHPDPDVMEKRIESLPTEVKRFFRYRQRAAKDHESGRKSVFDAIMRTILPGIVKSDSTEQGQPVVS